jgi:hypothetical protein
MRRAFLVEYVLPALCSVSISVTTSVTVSDLHPKVYPRTTTCAEMNWIIEAESTLYHVLKMERNDQLSIELLKMLNSQLSAMEQSESAVRERERIRAVVNHIADRVSLEKFFVLE